MSSVWRSYSDREVSASPLINAVSSCHFMMIATGASADVKAIARLKIDEIDAKINELKSLKKTLKSLVASCQGDDRPDCPIIDDLAGAISTG
jgi:hypothetical protein